VDTTRAQQSLKRTLEPLQSTHTVNRHSPQHTQTTTLKSQATQTESSDDTQTIYTHTQVNYNDTDGCSKTQDDIENDTDQPEQD
jgi:hypothetical protein